MEFRIAFIGFWYNRDKNCDCLRPKIWEELIWNENYFNFRYVRWWSIIQKKNIFLYFQPPNITIIIGWSPSWVSVFLGSTRSPWTTFLSSFFFLRQFRFGLGFHSSIQFIFYNIFLALFLFQYFSLSPSLFRSFTLFFFDWFYFNQKLRLRNPHWSANWLLFRLLLKR